MFDEEAAKIREMIAHLRVEFIGARSACRAERVSFESWLDAQDIDLVPRCVKQFIAGRAADQQDDDDDRLHYQVTPPDMRAEIEAKFGPLVDVTPHPGKPGYDALLEDWPARFFWHPSTSLSAMRSLCSLATQRPMAIATTR